MKKIIELSYSKNEMYEKFFPKIKDQVFHFTSGKNLASILIDNEIKPNKEDVIKTSAHSQNSLSKFLNAVSLFDLRDKEIEVIEEVRSMYNFLAPRFRDDTLVYLIMSPKYYKDIYTTDNVSKSHRDSTMYLPHIESFHINSLSIDKIDVIYRVKLTDALFD